MPGICGNGGRCLNTYGSYSCFCKTGFYGAHCEEFDPCRSISCVNGGTCMTNTSYPFWQCQCPHFHTGKKKNISTGEMCSASRTTLGAHCEQHFLSCSSNPCQVGSCQNLDNGEYRCQCPPSVTGRRCDTPALPCDSNPCLNKATCLSLSLSNYTCVCPPMYTGAQCSEERILCSKNPCQGNGTCVIDMSIAEETCQCTADRYGVQ